MAQGVVRLVTKDTTEGTNSIVDVGVNIPGRRKVEMVVPKDKLVNTNENFLFENTSSTSGELTISFLSYRRRDVTLDSQYIQSDFYGNVAGYQKPSQHGANFV